MTEYPRVVDTAPRVKAALMQWHDESRGIPPLWYYMERVKYDPTTDEFVFPNGTRAKVTDG